MALCDYTEFETGRKRLFIALELYSYVGGGSTIVLFGLGRERGTTADAVPPVAHCFSEIVDPYPPCPRPGPNLPAEPHSSSRSVSACVCKTRARTLPAGRLLSFTVHLVTDVGLLILLQWPFFTTTLSLYQAGGPALGIRVLNPRRRSIFPVFSLGESLRRGEAYRGCVLFICMFL